MRCAAVALGYFVALAWGLYVTFSPSVGAGFARVQTERGDGMLNHFVLEHTWRSVSDSSYHGSLFSPPVFYPEPATLWFSEHMLGVAPLYWGLRLFLAPEVAFQVWQIILTVGNFVAFALVVRWLRGPHALAILGGYLWAFALVHIDQMNHQQMIPRFWMPVAAYHAWMFVLSLRPEPSPEGEAPRPAAPLWHLGWMLAAAWLQCVTCVYTGWFLATALATFVPLAVLLRPGGIRGLFRFVRRDWLHLIVVLAVWGAAMAAAFVPYMVVNEGMTRLYSECSGLIPTPSAWFTPPPYTPWEVATRPLRTPVNGECQLFCGFGIYAVMLAAAIGLPISLLWKNRRAESAVALAALLTALVWVALTLSLRQGEASVEVEEPSLWEYVRVVPGADAIRVVSRVFVTVYLFGTLAAFVWLSRVTERLRPAARVGVLVVVAAWCVAEQQGYDPRSFEAADFYPVAARLAPELQKGDAAYVIPKYTDPKGRTWDWIYGEVFAMWAGLHAGVPTVNGYSGRLPGGGDFPPYGVVVTDDMLRQWLKGKFRGRLAIVDPDNPAATRVIVVE